MNHDTGHMRRALELAARGRGRTSPNPMVGCVAVRDDAVLGEGYHERAGGPHAEAAALEGIADLSGATVYVTLEPCCHHGKTPPCVDLLLAKRPARVVAAMEDPNPLVAGKGLDALRSAGIIVEAGLLEDEARALNEAYVKFITTGRPFVIAKCAMSLDGKIATHTGNSKWITSEAARAHVHQLRNGVDAILVGSGTIRKDNPSLTARLPNHEGQDPIRIVLDSARSLPPDANVFAMDGPAPTWIATASPDRTYAGHESLVVPNGHGRVDLKRLMRVLGERRVTSVLIEGGGETLASAFASGIVDKVLFFVAPKIIGGRAAVPSVGGSGIERLDEAIPLERMRAIPAGDDLLIEAYVKQEETD